MKMNQAKFRTELTHFKKGNPNKIAGTNKSTGEQTEFKNSPLSATDGWP